MFSFWHRLEWERCDMNAAQKPLWTDVFFQSLCFQVPAVAAKLGVTVVISPLLGKSIIYEFHALISHLRAALMNNREHPSSTCYLTFIC